MRADIAPGAIFGTTSFRIIGGTANLENEPYP